MSEGTQLDARWCAKSGVRRTLPLGIDFRLPEATCLVYFLYLSALTLVLRGRPHADGRVFAIFLLLTLTIATLSWFEANVNRLAFSIARDWTTLALVLASYRVLDWFATKHYMLTLERSWQAIDHVVLENWGLRHAIEAWGPAIPSGLELCYLLTSAAGCFGLIVFYVERKRDRAGIFLLIYVLGTLFSYAIIPLFPMQPPRIAFPHADEPQVATIVRNMNRVLLSGTGINTGVFPSAHVSSTFAAAWGMFTALPEKKVFGWIFLVYAAIVAVVTVYGRYHYAADALAGLLVSIIAAFVASRLRRLPLLKS